jgi:hypothetical protein
MNEFDYGRKYSKIFVDYLEQKDIIKLNKLNVAAIRRLNEVMELYRPVGRRFAIVTKLLERIDEPMKWKWVNILKSLKRQKELYHVCKMQLKTCGITLEQYKAIVREFDLFKKRFTDINSNIFPEYIKFTPLKEFEEELIAKGDSLDNMLNDYISEHENVYRMHDDDFEVIANDIFKKSTNTDYLKRLQQYHEDMELLKQRNKRVQKEEKLIKNKQAAEEKLLGFSKIVYKNINGNLNGLKKLDFDKIIELKNRGENNVKIIIAYKISSNKNTRGYYINKQGELTGAIVNALILAENESIPEVTQQMVDENKIAIAEVVFPA